MLPVAALFPVTGHKVESMLVTDEALLMMGKSVGSPEEFLAAWDKKISLVTKTKVAISAIRSVRKEHADKNVFVRYRAAGGIPGELEFAFPGESNYETFFKLLVRDHYFVREEAKATPFNAAVRYGLGFLFAVFCTVVMGNWAQSIADGTAEERSGKAYLFQKALEFLGPVGTWILGVAISAFLLYKVVQRYRNPPMQTRLTPPAS